MTEATEAQSAIIRILAGNRGSAPALKNPRSPEFRALFNLLAAGLSPLKPAAARLAAGRSFLSELDWLAAAKKDFAFESTLSGLTISPG